MTNIINKHSLSYILNKPSNPQFEEGSLEGRPVVKLNTSNESFINVLQSNISRATQQEKDIETASTNLPLTREEKLTIAQANYRKRNREELNKKNKIYYEMNREKILSNRQDKRLEKKNEKRDNANSQEKDIEIASTNLPLTREEKLTIAQANYRKRNREELNKKNKIYYEMNREKILSNRQNKRLKKSKNVDSTELEEAKNT